MSKFMGEEKEIVESVKRALDIRDDDEVAWFESNLIEDGKEFFLTDAEGHEWAVIVEVTSVRYQGPPEDRS